MRLSKIIFCLVVVFLFTTNILLAALDNPPTVGAPLDGGLLTILGAAGIAYYVTRKRKKASD